jgi:hypothetical protein
MATYFPCLIDDMDLSMQALFRSLTTLSILAVSLVKNHRVPGHLLTFNPNMTCILTAAQNITSLELGTTVLTGPTSPFCFETLTFPSLTSLLLYTIVFAGLPDNQEPPPSAFLDGQRLTVETFVLNHKATLQNLVLDNCAVPAPNGAWHRVFKRLRIQLSQLVEFSWITRHSRSDKKFIYAQPGGELNTYKVPEDDEPDNQNDTAALEDLQTAVILRRNNRSS